MKSPYPKTLEECMKYLEKLPGIGEKSAERIALAIIQELSDKEVDNFANVLKESKKRIRSCSICGHLCDDDICDICKDDDRNKNLICVVEDYKSVFVFEKTGNYNGVYHVLNGLISPADGVGIDDININGLINRVKNISGDCEIIIALKPNIAGDTTTLYIKKLFEKLNIKISRLSYGIPMGAEIDYLDTLTLDRALQDRKVIS